MPRIRLRWRDGGEERVETDDETVLDAAERAGVSLPFGCRHGACGTCTGRLLDGTAVHRRKPRALKPRQHEAGYVLTCVAVPREDCLIEVGREVRSDLYDDPWKG